MPIPSVITDLSATAASNYPAGSDAPSVLDDVQRVHASFIRELYDQLIGTGQTMTDVSGSRALVTGYTNSTGRPIFVHVRVTSSSAVATSVTLTIDGVSLTSATLTASGSGTHVSGIVPAGEIYSANISGAGTLSEWVELR